MKKKPEFVPLTKEMLVRNLREMQKYNEASESMRKNYAMEIARRANQDAIFEVTANEVTLLSCDDGSRESWSRFQ